MAKKQTINNAATPSFDEIMARTNNGTFIESASRTVGSIVGTVVNATVTTSKTIVTAAGQGIASASGITVNKTVTLDKAAVDMYNNAVVHINDCRINYELDNMDRNQLVKEYMAVQKTVSNLLSALKKCQNQQERDVILPVLNQGKERMKILSEKMK